MEPADPIPIQLTLEKGEIENENIILNHHSMLTPSNFNFSVLRNPTQNFQFRGILWCTTQNLIYKGFFIKKMGATKVSEKLMKPYCDIETDQSIELKIPIKDISEIFIGHDTTFQKRFQRYSKLRITFNGEDGSTMFYFYLTRENLIDDELYINKRCSEWKDKITELKEKSLGKAPAVPSSAKEVPTAPRPSTPLKGTEGLLKEVIADAEIKRYGRIIVKPLEEREKPKFELITKPIESKEEVKEELEFSALLDTLVPVSDEEFSAAAADSSIARCPHCGWILGYSTNKCPRCRKEI
ncbi:MAG TPA: hypothetical protein VMV49_15310 [Candidatus Deferrimicrobium sp.]|nr:hypothetical protein [Candidatus Deferrimicrobium sp.]